MITALSDFLAGRSQRERWLLSLLMLVVVPFVYVYSVVLPLNEQMDSQERELQESLALERWLVERRAEFARLPDVPKTAGPSTEDLPLPGLGEIEVRLNEAGLDSALGRLASADFGGIEMGFEDVPFTDLMPWLDTLLAETGYGLNRLTLIRSEDDGLVEADILLLPL